MDRMTDEHAAQLIDRMDGLTNQLAAANRSQRRLKIITAVLVVIVAVSAYLVLEVRANAKTACENANSTRAAQREHWSFFFEVTIAGNPDAPPAVLDFYDAYLHWLTDEVFADRDCSDLNRDYKIGDPPSYEEAVKAAQEQQRQESGR